MEEEKENKNLNKKEKQQNKKEKDKWKISWFNSHFEIVIIFSVAVILILGFLMCLQPLIEEKQKFSVVAVMEKETELAKQKKLLNALLEQQFIYQNISPYEIEKMKNFLPLKPDLPNLYYILDQLAREANYELISAQIEIVLDQTDATANSNVEKVIINQDDLESDLPEAISQELLAQSLLALEEEKKIREINMVLNLQGGGYVNLKNLFAGFDKNLRILDVLSFSYAPEEVDLKINLKTYFYN